MPNPSPTPIEPLLTVKDVCAVMRCHRDTLRDWCDRDLFPAPIVRGRNLFWRPEWVSAHIDAQARGRGYTA